MSVVPQHLRDELKFLKNCQVGYFTLSVGAGGAVLAFADNICSNGNFPNAYVYLAPLLVSIPCWVIFFDKSTTITRIVGYLRLMEGIEKSKEKQITFGPYELLGWENSLALFRKFESEKDLPDAVKDLQKATTESIWVIIKAPFLSATQKFWTLNWWSFFAIGAACLFQSYSSEFSIIWFFASALTLIATGYTAWVLCSLVSGADSYNGRFLLWRHVLFSEKAKKYFDNL